MVLKDIIGRVKVPAFAQFILRFGFGRGIEFYRVATKCDRDPRLLLSWATHYRGRGSRELYHGNIVDGHAYLAFAEMLRTTYDKLVAGRKPRRPILTKRQRRIKRALAKVKRKKQPTPK